MNLKFRNSHFGLRRDRNRRHGQPPRATALGAIALMLTVSACQSAPDNATGASTDSSGSALKIGSLLPTTGDLAQYGGPMEDSTRLLIETVNSCGGVMGQPVELISEDDQTEPSAGASAMTKLAEVDQVAGVVGAAASSVSSAAVDIAVRNQVVQISPASTSPIFTERAAKGDFGGFWFRTAPPDTFQGKALAELAQEQGFDTVAVLGINNDYGNGLIQSFTTAFTELGGTVVNESNPTRYAPDSASFESEVSDAFGEAPDAVLVIAYPETGSLILKAAYEQGFLEDGTQVILTDGMKEDNLAQQVGQASDGSFIASGMVGTAPSAGGPAIASFNEIYQGKYNREPSVYDPNSWDAAALMVLAAEAAQDTTGTAVRDHIPDVANAPGEEVTDVCQALALVREGQDINYQGASGPVDLDENGDVVGSYDIWSIGEDGSIQVIDTISIGG